MRTYSISYDLADPGRNKHAVSTAIMNLGQAWARPLESTWYVRAGVSEGEIRAALAGLLDGEDGLVVQAVDREAVCCNTALRWFRRRAAAEDGASPNVIAFPTPEQAAA